MSPAADSSSNKHNHPTTESRFSVDELSLPLSYWLPSEYQSNTTANTTTTTSPDEVSSPLVTNPPTTTTSTATTTAPPPVATDVAPQPAPAPVPPNNTNNKKQKSAAPKMAEESNKGADGKPKKKERPSVTTPAPVATAYVLIRYALARIVGDSATAWECSPFQATFLKETPHLTGKFSLTLPKQQQTSSSLVDAKGNLQIPAAQLWSLLQDELKDLLGGGTGSPTLTVHQASKQTVLETYSAGVLDESFTGKKSKVKPHDTVSLVAAVAGDQTVLVCNALATPYALPATGLTAVELDLQQSDIKEGTKKGLQITIKFKAQPAAEAEAAALATVQESTTSLPALAAMPVTERVQQLVAEQQQKEEEATTVAAASATEATAEATTATTEMHVDPFNVEGTIDYNKLVEQFGSNLIDADLLQRLEAATVGQGRVPFLHRFLRRGIFFSHRDLAALLSCVEKGDPSSGVTPMYLYTGRGPSSSAMHLGHLVPFLFTQWLQQAFDCPLVIQMTDDEKFIFKGEYDEHEGDNLNYFQGLTIENARDIIACGFDFNKTFLFSDLDYIGKMYPNICRIWKAVTTNTVNGIFGFDGSSNLGKIAFPAVQAAPSFASSFPTVLNVPESDRRKTKMACLIPCAIDQDPYFRMTRDIAHKLVDKKIHPIQGKPALIHSKFFPPLQGAQGKMSSSNTNSAIFLTDTADEIAHKIRAYCFSGGRETKAEQEKYGANIEIDVAYQWLRFFLEDDDELASIGKDYSSGSGEYWSTGKVKQRLITVLQELVAAHQERRAKITDEEVRKWMTERCLVVLPKST